MRGKLGIVALFVLMLPAVPLAMPANHGTPGHLAAVTTLWPAGTTGDFTATDLAPLLPAVVPRPLATVSASSSSYYYVGADSQVSSALSNSGIGAKIQVVSAQATGCLSFWVADDSSANIWGQVGYYLCNGSVPVAFYQIWNLNTYTVLVTGTASVSTGSHQFSMYSQSGSSTWAFALDGSIFGTYNMGSSTSSSTYPIEALSEEGSVSTPWNPPQVQFTQIQVMGAAGTWSSVATGFVPYGCGSTSYSCWGAAGNMQNPSVPTDAVVVGGSTPAILSGSVLWNGVTSTSTTTTSTSSILATSSTATAAVTTTSSSSTAAASTQTGTLSVLLTVSPSTNTRKSTEYFSVYVTDQNGRPVGGAGVTLSVVRPDGKVATLSASTDSAGQANIQYRLSASAPLGTYAVSVTASAPAYVSGSATGTFVVN